MEKPKKPLFKRWYFWVLVVLVLAAIGSALGDEDAGPAATPTPTATATPTPEPSLSPEEMRAQAESNDLMINASVEAADRYYDILVEAISGLEDGTSSLLDVYSTCEDMEEYLRGFSAHVDEVTDPAAEEYKDAAIGYIGNFQLVAHDLMEYIDSGEMSDLSDAQEGLELAPAYIAQLLAARTAYLEAAGFSGDEIAEMLS